MNKGFTKKLCSVLLALVMVLTLLLAFPLPAAAADSDDSDGTTVFDELGIDTSELPDGWAERSEENPYGTDSITIAPVYEFFMDMYTTGGSNNHIRNLWGDDNTGDWSHESNDTITYEYDAYRSAAGDFTNSGLDGQVVSVGADISGGTVSIESLIFTDPTDEDGSGTMQKEIFSNGTISIPDSADYKKQNYLQIAVGDFNNDGYDEVAVYVPDGSDPRIEVYQLTDKSGTDPWLTASNWEKAYTYSLPEVTVSSLGIVMSGVDFTPNMVDLTAGDVDQDGTEDLGVTWGYYNGGLLCGASKVTVLFGSDEGTLFDNTRTLTFTPQCENTVKDSSGKDVTEITKLVRVSLDLGDVDGDSENEVALAGECIDDITNNASNTRYLSVYEYDHDTASSTYGELVLYGGSNNTIDLNEEAYRITGLRASEKRYYGYFSEPGLVTDMTCIQQDGVGTQEYVYLDGILYVYTGDSFTVETDLDGSPGFVSLNGPDASVNGLIVGDSGFMFNTKHREDQYYYNEYGAFAADFDGDGYESLYLMQIFTEKEYQYDNHSDASGFTDLWDNGFDEWTVDGVQNNHYCEKQNLSTPYYMLRKIDTTCTQNTKPETTTEQTVDGHGNIVSHDVTEQVGLPVVWQYDYESDTPYGCTQSVMFAMPDTDKDTMLLKYNSYELVYSDPMVLAALASPPYFSDLEHLDGGDNYIYNSYTSFGKSSSTESGTSATGTITVGAYVTREHAFTKFKLEFETEFTSNWTWETEQSSTVTSDVSYTTFGGQNSVALYCVPMDDYTYDALEPVTDENGVTTWEAQTIDIKVPYTPVVKVLDADTYDKIAEKYSLPTVGDDIFTQTLGRPQTYPSAISSAMVTNGYNTPDDYIGMGFGNSSATQSLTLESSTTETFSYTLDLTFKLGGGIEDKFMVGGILGGEGGAGTSTTTANGVTYEASVVNMPVDAADYGYYYAWKLLEYNYKYNDPDDGSTVEFPVITYMVTDEKYPPQLPQNLEVTDVQKDSVTLKWDETGSNLTGYHLYRMIDFPYGSSYSLIADVPAGTDTYTDTDVDPGTEYTYVIQSYRSALPKESVMSNEVTACTLPEVGAPTITGPTDTVAYPDRSADLSVTVTNGAGASVGTAYYQWQKLTDGEWENVSGAESDTLTFTAPEENDTGRYRCRVNQVVDKTPYSFYSNSARLTVNKRVSVMELSTSQDNTAVTLSAKLYEDQNNLAGAQTGVDPPLGTVYFRITGSDYSATASSSPEASPDSKYSTASVEWTPPEDGAYEVTAYYYGNSVYDAADSVKKTVLFGEAPFYKLDVDNSFEYGDTFTPAVELYEENGTTAEPVTSGVTYGVAKMTATLVPGNTTTTKTPVGDTVLTGAEIKISSDGLMQVGITTNNDTKWGNLSDTGDFELGTTASGDGTISVTAKGATAGIMINENSGTTTIVIPQDPQGEVTVEGTLAYDITGTSPDYTVSGASMASATVTYTDCVTTQSYLTGITETAFSYEPVSGWENDHAFDAKEVGSFRLTADVSTTGGDISLVGYFTVTPRAVTITAPSADIGVDEVRALTAGDLTFTPGLVFGDTADDLGLLVECYNSAGKQVTFAANSTPAGSYATKAAEAPETYTATGTKDDGTTAEITSYNTNYLTQVAARADYDITYADGVYNVTTTRYTAACSAEQYLGKTVGGVSVIKPDSYDPATDITLLKYPVGTNVTFKASPLTGYEVNYWSVTAGGGTPYTVSEAELNDPTTLTKKMVTGGLSVSVTFRVETNKLTYGGANGIVSAVANELSIPSGTVLNSGAEITLTGTGNTDPAYHLAEWRVTKGGTTTRYTADGSTFSLTMPDSSVAVTAVFDRDSYTLTLGDHLDAYAGGAGVASGGLVVGDSEVVVEPEPGYETVSGGKWYKDGGEVTAGVAANNQSYTFNITADTAVTADVEIKQYTVSWNAPDYGAITVTAAGEPIADSGLSYYGGTTITATAVPDDGYRLATGGWSNTTGAGWTSSGNVLTCPALNGDLTINAAFEAIPTYTISVSWGTHGSISCEVNGGETALESGALTVREGDDVTFTAVPDTGFMLDYWQQDGGDKDYAEEETLSLDDVGASTPTSVYAAFKSIPYYEVTYGVMSTSSGSGTLAAAADGTAFDSGAYIGYKSALTFTATPDVGSYVGGWYEN